MPEKIAVVGSGIYGISVALALSENHDYEVHLFEKNPDILLGASRVNQLRLHFGYHYPRSKETIASCLQAAPKFMAAYPQAIISDDEHYYAIVRQNEVRNPQTYLQALNDNNLKYEANKKSPIVNAANVGLQIQAPEARINYTALKSICVERLKNSKVILHLNKEFENRDGSQFDYTIICTYGLHNHFLQPHHQTPYKWQLVEKIVVNLPGRDKHSVVVMDGDFLCIDPLDNTRHHILGNVIYAIHNENIGAMPYIPKRYENYINKGIISTPLDSNFDKFRISGMKFLPILEQAEYVGSMYTFRVVLTGKEATDERPMIVRWANDEKTIITVFSGKLSYSMDAASLVAAMLAERTNTTISPPTD